MEQIHHLLSYCNCYIGESATMSGEAVLLGVPAVYAACDRRSYTDELAAMGLLWKVPSVDYQSLQMALGEVEALGRDELPKRLAAYLEGKVNLADYIVDAVIRQAGPAF